MDEQQLIDHLDRLVGDVPVGPAPTRATLGPGRRRRSYAVVAGAVAAAVLVVVGIGLVLPPREDDRPLPTPTDPVVAPAPGTVWVGRGHAAIAVPADWDVDPRCGQRGASLTSSVFVDLPISRLSCLQPGPAGAFVVVADPVAFGAPAEGRTTQVDGVPAVRRDGECAGGSDDGGQPAAGCSGSVRIDSQAAYFLVMAQSARAVDDLLDSVRVLPDQVAVPSVDRPATVEAYRSRLEALGLVLGRAGNEANRSSPYPAPGTLVPAGSPVRFP